MKKLDYQEAYTSEQHNHNSYLGLKLSIALGRDITENDNKSIQKYISLLEKELQLESFRLDPETENIAKAQRAAIIALFPDTPIFVKEIPNQYYSDYGLSIPWYEITCRIGKIIVGWRKRVIHIEWKESTVRFEGEDIFPQIETDKGPDYIHAWSYEDAADYIRRLFYVSDNGLPELHLPLPNSKNNFEQNYYNK